MRLVSVHDLSSDQQALATVLQSTVEDRYESKASLVGVVSVSASLDAIVGGDVDVHVFKADDIFKVDHRPLVRIAYAWTMAVDYSDRAHVFTQLDIGPIRSPRAAVLAKAADELRKRKCFLNQLKVALGNSTSQPIQ